MNVVTVRVYRLSEDRNENWTITGVGDATELYM